MKNPSHSFWMRALAAGLIAAIASCSNDRDPVPRPTFDLFVIDQFGATADDTEPVEINDREFTFGEDPSAFDDLLR